ncbi:unnamed protein product [Alopecurus aequalis]
MASLADISKLLDEKLAAARKEIVDDLPSTVLHKIETDIADLKEQATANQAAIADLKEQADANRVTIARLEKNSSSQIFSKEDPTQAKQSPHPHRSSPSVLEGTGEWKPKFHKLEFPIFDGSEDALSWLTRVEQFFDGQGTPESNKLAAIKNLRQIGSVDDYEENFLTLICRCEGLTEAHQVELFVAGLHKSICTDVKLMYPTTLEDAMDHARAYEERETPEDSDSILVSKGNSGGGVRPSTPELVAPPKAIAALPTKRPLLRLSPTEMDERRAKGLCYSCDDKYAPGHRCKRIYACWVDASEEEAPDPLETNTGS